MTDTLPVAKQEYACWGRGAWPRDFFLSSGVMSLNRSSDFSSTTFYSTGDYPAGRCLLAQQCALVEVDDLLLTFRSGARKVGLLLLPGLLARLILLLVVPRLEVVHPSLLLRGLSLLFSNSALSQGVTIGRVVDAFKLLVGRLCSARLLLGLREERLNQTERRAADSFGQTPQCIHY